MKKEINIIRIPSFHTTQNQIYQHSCKKAGAAVEAAIDYEVDLGCEGVPVLDYETAVLDCAEVLEQDLYLQLPVGCTLYSRK